MLDGIIRSRRSNGQKIDLKLSRNGHGLPFDKHLTTGSFNPLLPVEHYPASDRSPAEADDSCQQRKLLADVGALGQGGSRTGPWNPLGHLLETDHVEIADDVYQKDRA